MDLSGIISISGRPGLYKVIAQGKNSIIVESLVDKKRFPAYSSDRISALEDISIYTIEDDKPLTEILAEFYEKQEGKEGPSHKDDIATLTEYLMEILPNYDDERIYPSDIKKLFQWYNLLHKAGCLEPSEEEEEKEKEAEKSEEKPKAAAKEAKETKEAKEAKPKKAPVKKAAPKKDSAKEK